MAGKSILVTGIGGNVGQGILRNVRSLDLGLEIIGTNVTSVSGGNHLCDRVVKVPFAYDPGYIDAMVEICNTYHIDLIIPSTDFETLYLSQHVGQIPAEVASSDFSTCAYFVDKYKTYLRFNELGIPFAASVEPSQYKGEFTDIVAKPKSGRGSRGILINPPDWSQLDDESYMIQEMAHGIELTTAFYVDKTARLHSHITFERELENGATVLCRATGQYDALILPIIHQMVEYFTIKGSCNIQYILSSEQQCIPFEINGRISGTNSIRTNFGFRDVQWTLQEYLLGEPLENAEITTGVATRILMDVIYPDANNYDNLSAAQSHYIY